MIKLIILTEKQIWFYYQLNYENIIKLKICIYFKFLNIDLLEESIFLTDTKEQ